MDFLTNIVVAVLRCKTLDLERAREVIKKVDEEIYDDMFEELTQKESGKSNFIDPVVIAYNVVLYQAKAELNNIIDDAVDWYLSNNPDDAVDREFLMLDYDNALEKVYVSGNYIATTYDACGELVKFLRNINFKDYLTNENISLSESLEFFLNELPFS